MLNSTHVFYEPTLILLQSSQSQQKNNLHAKHLEPLGYTMPYPYELC